MAQISLQDKIIYGPIFSRRLGRSFGINLLPTGYKLCSFNCIYCQYGATQWSNHSPKIEDLPEVDEVLVAVENALRKPRSMDVLTFSGNGEPTLHPNFLEIVQGVRLIKDRLRPTIKLALLSNSSRVMDPDVQKAIDIIEIPMMKLDAGDQRIFEAINRPACNIILLDILEGFKKVKGLIVQSMLIDGPTSNISGSAFQSLVDVLKHLNPKAVHIYSSERPTAENGVVKVNISKLKQMETQLMEDYGIKACAFWSDGA